MNCIVKFNVLDPDTPFDFHTNPEQAFYNDADPDLTYQNDGDPCGRDQDPQHW
jgi:hypothetical protein